MANKLKNCPGCGRLYIDSGSSICPDCYQKELEAEETVAAYVREHQGATVVEVCEATGISERVVRRMIRQGRFANIPGVNLQYPCVKCGAMIDHGDYCSACQRQVTADLVAQQKAIIDAAARKTAGMYSMDRRDERK